MTNLAELPTRTRWATLSVAALAMACGVVAVAAPIVNAASADPLETGDWQVIAHGLIELDAGDHQWAVEEVSVTVGLPTELEFSDPSFVVGAAGATIVASDTLAARVLTGEATFHPSDDTATLEAAASAAASVMTIALGGAQADNTSVAIPLLAGRYDVDLVRDVVAAGEESSLTSSLPIFVLVTDGSVTDSLGDEFGAGQSSTLDGEVVLTATDEASTTVIAAIVTPVPSGEDTVAPPVPAAPATTSVGSATTAPATTAPASTTTLPADSDMDGLTDAEEAALGTNPLNNDSDADFLYDADEVNMWNSDPNDPDSDGDGLLDGDEANTHGSSPTASDTDGDGVSDYDEAINLRSNPNDVDSDGDGLDDYVEWTAYGTDPTVADTDGDLDSDGYEVSMGTNPLDASDFTT